MTLSLLNPALLLGTLLIAVPVLMHLFAKARPKEFPFPSLQWLRQVERKTTNLRKPKDWLLLLLRTLAIAGIVGAFLQPLLFRGEQLTATGTIKTVVIVVDRSASMAFVEKGQSRLSRALGRAEEVLRSAGSRALVNLVWLDAAPDAEFPDPGVNVDALMDSLRRAQVVLEAGDVGAAMRLALEQLGRGEGAKELYLVSDFQASAWKAATITRPPNVTLVQLPVAETEAANVAITSVVLQPERPVQGTEARLLARVRNFSPAEVKTTVQLGFGEVRRTQAVTIAPWGEGVTEFRVPCGRAGLQSLAVSLPEDDFPADDRRFTTVEIRENRRVAVEGPEGDGSFVLWRRVLASLGWLDLQESAAEPEVVVAVRPSLERAADLRTAAERGATVICQPGESWTGGPWMTLWRAGESGAVLREETRDRDVDKPWTFETAQEDHPLWQVFRGGEFGDPAGGGVWKRLHVMANDEQILLRYADGVAAIAVQRAGQGWVILWNLELDEAHSDRVHQPSLLVLVGELLLHHGESSGSSVARLFTPADPVSWQPPQTLAADQVRLEDETGVAQSIAYEEGQGPLLFRARESLAPGNYKWLLDSQLAERASVNFPADAESDLRTVDPNTLSTGSSFTLSAAARLAAQRDGEPLWPLCLGVALVTLLLESVVARSSIRTPASFASR